MANDFKILGKILYKNESLNIDFYKQKTEGLFNFFKVELDDFTFMGKNTINEEDINDDSCFEFQIVGEVPWSITTRIQMTVIKEYFKEFIDFEFVFTGIENEYINEYWQETYLFSKGILSYSYIDAKGNLLTWKEDIVKSGKLEHFEVKKNDYCLIN